MNAGKLESFGDDLRAAREAAGLTRVQLAQRIGVNPTQVERIENGRVDPSEWRKRRYLAACTAGETTAQTLIEQLERDIADRIGVFRTDLETVMGEAGKQRATQAEGGAALRGLPSRQAPLPQKKARP
jgi:transcriptional regulator with XRE-family HTH domain